jgi:DNA-binding LytR/AlgR family response regulator
MPAPTDRPRKFRNGTISISQNQANYRSIQDMQETSPHPNENKQHSGKPEVKTRIVVRKGKSFIPIALAQSAMFYSSSKISFILCFDGSKYILEYSLSELEQILDPRTFFRVNRSTILNIATIREYHCTKFGKIIIDIVPIKQYTYQVLVSQYTAPAFKRWVEDE